MSFPTPQLPQGDETPLNLAHGLLNPLEGTGGRVWRTGLASDGPELQRVCAWHRWASAPDHRLAELEECPTCVFERTESGRGRLRYLRLHAVGVR